MGADGPAAIDVERIVEDARLRPLHLQIFLICFATSIADGLDTQLIGFSASSIASDLKLPLSAFGTIFSASAAGMLVGALSLGMLADQIGRKRSLVCYTAILAAFTIATMWATSLHTLLVVRFLAGIGLGGALPGIFTLVSEYSPGKRRGLAVGLLWTGYPIGGMIGGALGSYLIPAFGWHSVFALGGALAVAILVLQVALLPESLQFLAIRGVDPSRIAGIIRRIDPQVPHDATFTIKRNATAERAPVRALFADGLLPVTVLVWVPMFCTYLITNFFVLWAPALFRQSGYTISSTALLVALNNFAAVPNQALAGYLIDRMGAFRVVIVSYLSLSAAILAIASVLHIIPAVATMMLAIGLLQGPGIAGTMYIATRVYPSAMRSTGVGWALGISRTGQIAGSLAVGAALAAKLPVALIFGSIAVPALVGMVGSVMLYGVLKRRSPRFDELIKVRSASHGRR